MPNFLDSSVLPGDSMPKHEHRKMTIILVIVVIVAIAILASLLYVSKQDDQAVTGVDRKPVVTVDPRVVEINNYQSKLTEQQKVDAVKEIKNYKSSMTEQEKNAQMQEILKYSIKK